MTTTDRRDADDATFTAEMHRLNRLEVADEDTERRLATLLQQRLAFIGLVIRDVEVHFLARAAIAALKPAPGTDSSGQAVQRVENVVTCTHDGQPEHVWQPGERCPDAIPAGTWAVRRAAAVAGPQRDHGGEGGQVLDERRPCPHGCAGGHTEDEYHGGGCRARDVEPFEGWGPGR